MFKLKKELDLRKQIIKEILKMINDKKLLENYELYNIKKEEEDLISLFNIWVNNFRRLFDKEVENKFKEVSK